MGAWAHRQLLRASKAFDVYPPPTNAFREASQPGACVVSDQLSLRSAWFASQHIFDKIALADNVQYLVRASYLEIYNEEIRDLLSKVNYPDAVHDYNTSKS